jgi:prevent-host-death family protein
MKIASVAEVKSQFSAFVKASAGGPVVVTKNGRPVAVLVGVQDEEEIERLLMAYSPRLRAILDLSRKQISEGGGVRHDEFWAEAAPPKARKGRGKAKGTKGKAGDGQSPKDE